MGREGRREYPRFAVETAVDLLLTDGTAVISTARNLSRGGVCLETASEVAAGTEVEVRLTLVFDPDSASEPLSLRARVAWSTPIGDGHQLGCQFLALSGEQLTYLDMFLRYLEPETDDDDDADLRDEGGDREDDPFER